jgi:type I restriction enzyme, S subunit
MRVKWQKKRLGEVCEIIKGRKPMLKATPSAGDMPYLVAKVMRGTANAKFASVEDRNAIAVDESETIIICDGSNSGEVFSGFRGILSSTMGKITKSEEIDDRYLRAFLASAFDLFNRGKTGAAIPHLDKEALYQLECPFPPLPEQHRIVGILEEAFTGIVTAKANHEKNLQNSHALFGSAFGALTPHVEQANWIQTKVAEVAATKRGSMRTGPFGSQLLHSEFVDEGIAVLGIDNAVANEFRWGKSRFITPEKYQQLERYKVYPGDVLITIMGTCGRCAIVPEDIPEAINTKHLCCITLDQSKCIPDYLHAYFLHHPLAQEFLVKHAKGAIMAGLNMGLIQQLPVLLPPVKKQKELVRVFDSLREKTKRLVRVYERKLTETEALKKSLLHQAFAGGL